jgi:hypothetical protein
MVTIKFPESDHIPTDVLDIKHNGNKTTNSSNPTPLSHPPWIYEYKIPVTIHSAIEYLGRQRLTGTTHSLQLQRTPAQS